MTSKLPLKMLGVSSNELFRRVISAKTRFSVGRAAGRTSRAA